VNTTPDPQQLVAALLGPSPTYKRAEIDAVVAHREATTPLLLARLAEIVADPEGAVARIGEDFDAVYTVVVLAWFREEAAHDDLVRFARLPGETIERLLGEHFVTEDFGRLLLATAGTRTDGLVAILTDREADEYVRTQAADALVTAVGAGHVSRDAGIHSGVRICE
jgi:hypothetical protein